MIQLDSREEVEALTDAQAVAVLDAAREKLIEQLTAQRTHPHLLDDCGDYLAAATDNWSRLFHNYWNHDGEGFVNYVRQFLLESPDEWGGADGEVRFELVRFAWGD